MKKYGSAFLIIALCLCMTSCSRSQPNASLDDGEKNTIYITSSSAHYEPTELLQLSDLILQGRVVQKNDEVMSNPDNTLVNKDGVLIGNALITDYTVEIDRVYKGSYDEETIHVKTNYGDGLTPELILNGEDEDSVLATKPDKIELSTEGDCILLLTYIDTGYEESSGYFPIMMLGYLTPDGTGQYTNNASVNNITLTTDSLVAELAELE